MSERLLPQRLADGARTVCVKRAINACTPATRRGKRSKVWQLNDWLQCAVAEMVCVHKATLDEVLVAFKDELKSIDRSSLNRWLKPIIAAYQGEVNRVDLSDETTLEMTVHDGDIVAQMSKVWGSAMVMLAKYLKDTDWNDLATPEKYTLLRFLEGATDAGKVAAQAQEHEAKTQRILLQVKAIISAADGKPRADRAVALRDAYAQIDKILGLGKEVA